MKFGELMRFLRNADLSILTNEELLKIIELLLNE